MRIVTRRTGLSAEVLRVWERRYGVVKPGRTQTGRRLYSDAEIERLQLLYRATLGGRSIGLVASLPTPALTELLRQDAAVPAAPKSTAGPTARPGPSPADQLVRECLRAVEAFSAEALGVALERARLALPAIPFLDDVVVPLVDRVDARGRAGALRTVHSHLVSNVVRRVLDESLCAAPAKAPRLLVAAIAPQMNELGPPLLAVAAVSEGWSVTCFSSGLPAEDIAEAAAEFRAHAVALSLAHSTADAGITAELRRLHSALPKNVRVIVRTSAPAGYAGVLEEIGAVRVPDLSAFTEQLRGVAHRTTVDRIGTPRRVRRDPRLP